MLIIFCFTECEKVSVAQIFSSYGGRVESRDINTGVITMIMYMTDG